METESNMDGMHKILVVDDDIIVRKVLSSQLESNIGNVSVICSDDTRHALTNLMLNDFSLLICDIILLEGNGIHLAKTLRGINRFYHLPIILISAVQKVDEDLLAEIPNSEATFFLEKPIDPRELESKVNVSLNYWKFHEKNMSPRESHL